MIKLNLYFTGDEGYNSFRKGIINFEKIITPNPETDFHRKVLNILDSYLRNIEQWLNRFYRTKLPFEEIDLIIVDRYPKSAGSTYYWLNPPKIFIGINEKDPAFGDKGNFVYLIHEFGHIYQNYFLEKNILYLESCNELNKKQLKFLDKIRNITHATIELLAEYQVRKFFGLIKDYWEQQEDYFSPGHKFTKKYRDEIYRNLYKKWENKKIGNVYRFFEESLKLFKV
jgi:hypothetical protein